MRILRLESCFLKTSWSGSLAMPGSAVLNRLLHRGNDAPPRHLPPAALIA